MNDRPNIYNKRGVSVGSKRGKAIAMYLEGKNIDEVTAALSLDPGTARVYLHYARKLHAKRDPLLD